jgi:hypothetical protein
LWLLVEVVAGIGALEVVALEDLELEQVQVLLLEQNTQSP